MDQNARHRARALVVVAIVCAALTLMLALMRGLISGWNHPLTLVLFISAVCMALIPPLLKWSGNLERVGAILPICAALSLSTMAMIENGLDSEALFWMPFAPFIAAYFASRRVAVMVGVFLAAMLGWIHLGMGLTADPAEGQRLLIKFVTIIVALGFGVALALIHETLHIRAQQRIFEQHRISESTLRALPDLVMILSPEGDLVHASRPSMVGPWSELLKWFGPRDRRRAPRHVTEAFPGVDRDRIRQQLQRAEQTPDVTVVEEYRVTLGDEQRNVEVRATSDDGTQIVAVARDITTLRELDGARLTYISSVANALRTPVAAISTSLKLVTGGVVGDVPLEIRDFVDRASSNAQKLNALVDDLLDAELLRDNNLSLDLEPVMLNSIIRDCISQEADLADRRKVTLKVEDAPAGTEILCDKKRLQQALCNLVSNAIKASRPGGDVVVRGGRSDVRGWVQIVDQGPGIPNEYRAKLFTRYSELKPERSDETSESQGLSMYMTDQLILQMNGDLNYVSDSKSGTTFTVAVPRFNTKNAPADPAASPMTNADSS